MALREVAEELRRLRHLGEWLLHDVRWLHFGTSVELLFNNVFDSSGAVRADALESPRLIAIRMRGVQIFNLSNGLSPAMLDEPERIDWGVSEVARVQAWNCDLPSRSGVRLEVIWDGPRNLEVIAAGIQIVAES